MPTDGWNWPEPRSDHSRIPSLPCISIGVRRDRRQPIIGHLRCRTDVRLDGAGVTGGLPDHDFAARRARLVATLAQEELAGLYVTDAADIAWLTGFIGSNGAILVGADGRCILATDARYDGRVQPDQDLEVRIDRDLFTIVVELISDHQAAGPIAFDPAAVTHARAVTWLDRTDGSLVTRSGLVARLRRRKDDAELARLALACRLTVQAWEETVVAADRAGTLAGTTERELAVAIERSMVDLGADGLAFPSIVASGPNSAIPHHEPSHRVIAAGDLLTCDIGARVDGYHADFTRTIAVGGHLDDDLADIHAVVERAQRAGVAAVRVGQPIVDIDTVARDVIAEAGFGAAFVHGVGHGVGLVIHEDPLIALAGADTLEAGMVLTVEPGIYLPGRGGVRIEDTVAVTDEGPVVLTPASTSVAVA